MILKISVFLLSCLTLCLQIINAQQISYTPRIENCDCAFKSDSLKTRCAYLVVPENRSKPNGRIIKLPFIIVESNNPHKRPDPVLYTAGGPGASSLGGVKFIHEREFIKDRDYIAFEQRGTWFALPRLNCFEVSEMLKESYRKGLNRDSMVLEGVKACRKRLVAAGIDLAAYNTEENAADIEDLRRVFEIDSINLVGISYSGGLMLTMVRNYPQHVRSIVLDSPLPGFLSYDESALFNINEAFDKIFANCQRDSSNKELYGDLKQRFRNYFTSIGNKEFYFMYKEKNARDSIRIRYTRDELIDFLLNILSNNQELKNAPFFMTQIISGNHSPFMIHYFDDIFRSGENANGMRYSVYCSEQLTYANEEVIKKENQIFPWLAGYHFNNVNHAICRCWDVPPENPIANSPVLSNVPALLGAGDTDPWCRPVFNDWIYHFLPNSQRLLFTDKTHGPILSTGDGDQLLAKFLDNPFQKIAADGTRVRAY
jgi:pimeloyl-ACP methyl ester carboxylesterase